MDFIIARGRLGKLDNIFLNELSTGKLRLFIYIILVDKENEVIDDPVL